MRPFFASSVYIFILFFIVPGIDTKVSAFDRKEVRDLRFQLKGLKTTRKALEKYNRKSAANNKKIATSIHKCRKALNAAESRPEIPQKARPETKDDLIQSEHSKFSFSRKKRLQRKIASEKERIRKLEAEKAKNDSAYNDLKLTSLGLTATPGNYNLPQQKALQDLRKETLYGCRKQYGLKKALSEQTDLKQAKKLLENVKADNLKYSKMIAEGKQKAIDKPFQFKDQVYKGMPSSKEEGSGPSANAGAVQGYMKQFTDLRGKSRMSNEILDTTSMELNPYRGKPIIERLKPTYNFQFIATDAYQPARMESAVVLKFLLTPKSTPFIGVGYTLGMGNGIEDIKFSNQGFGTRLGYEYQLFHVIGVFGSYEYKFERTVDESYRRPFNHRMIIGITAAQGKLYIGYNALHLLGYKSESPFVFRIGIK